jgi:hypothetical protein
LALKLNPTDPEAEGAVSVKLLKVFSPVIVFVGTVAVLEVNDTLLNVNPPPEKDAVALERLIWEVPALSVMFAALKIRPFVPPIVIVLDPKFSVFAAVPIVWNAPVVVTLKFAVVKVPFETVILRNPVSRASPSVSVIPVPATVSALNCFPAVIKVPVPLKVT